MKQIWIVGLMCACGSILACNNGDSVGAVNCENGATQQVKCGAKNRGEKTQLCVEYKWVDQSECIDDSTCFTDGATQTEKCGLNDRGTATQTCEDGTWSELHCVDPDDCVDQDIQKAGCGIGGAGTQLQTCENGTWVLDGVCDEKLDCEEDDTDERACGLNNNGSQTRGCVENLWGEWAACDDPDVCVNDDAQTKECAGTSGQGANGAALVHTRICAGGRWGDWGHCEDPDECHNGAGREGPCGADDRGWSEDACVDGQWDNGPCVQVADALFSAHSGYRAIVDKDHGLFSYALGDNADGLLGNSSFTGANGLYPQKTEVPTPWKSNVETTRKRFDGSSTHGCAIAQSGELYCWGDNTLGELGRDPATLSSSTTPVMVMLPGHPKAVSTGVGFSCATTISNTLYCWGDNRTSQLGHTASSQPEYIPTEVKFDGVGPNTSDLTNTEVLDFGVGRAHACAIVKSTYGHRNDAVRLVCWGANDWGQAAEVTDAVISTPTHHTTSGSLHVTGDNKKEPFDAQLAVGGDHTVVSTATTEKHETGTGQVYYDQYTHLYGFGRNDVGQLGDLSDDTVRTGKTLLDRGYFGVTDSYVPIARADNTCIIDTSVPQCTGDNRDGQISNDPATEIHGFTEIPTDSAIDDHHIGQFALGNGSVCVVLDWMGRILCRGNNDHGQLGDGSTTSRTQWGWMLHKPEN